MRLLQFVWFRFRASLARTWSGLLAIVLLLALTGGIALASIAGARSTQSAYPNFLASTNPSDLTVSSFGAGGAPVASLKKAIAGVHDVKRVTSLYVPPFTLVTASGAPIPSSMASVFTVGSPDGELYSQDRVTAVHGVTAEPAKPNDVLLTPSAARQLRAHVGTRLRLGLFPNRAAPAVLRVNATVVGIVDFDNQVIQDDIDAAFGFMVVTPALIHKVIAVAHNAAAPTLYGVQLGHGSRDVADVERALIPLIPNGAQYEFHERAPVVAQFEDAIRPESIALGAFGMIAALVALVLTAQAIARYLRSGDDDRRVLRALGAEPAMTIADGLVGALGAILVGSVLAAAVAVGLSPLAPLGPVRAVYRSGLAFDWAVLALGVAVSVTVLSGVAFGIAYRRAPHRIAGRDHARRRPSRAARASADAGLPAPVVTGVRFAFESGGGRAAVPVRSALTGTVIAIALVVATLTFASGLRTLVSHPPLYGWNWNSAINPSSEVPQLTRTLLTHDPDVAGWAGASEAIFQIDGQSVPTLLTMPRAAVAPPILSGHGLERTDQVVLGAATLARLHKHVGDDVVVSYGTAADAPAYVPLVHVRVVGTSTLPAVGFESFVADHTSMGTGALLPVDIESPAFRKVQVNADPLLNGPDLVFVRLRAGVSARAARVSLARIVLATDRAFDADPKARGNNITVVGVQRPAQIVNYRGVGSAPVVLAAGLAVGAALALSLTLLASVRRRRRELALLKTLGFTRRQLAGVVACQSAVAVVVGIVIGVPVGILTGRAAWDLFARTINAVPKATVPGAAIALVAIGALVLANVIAAIPGIQAARTPTALLLHAE